jgi:hypothetical protein
MADLDAMALAIAIARAAQQRQQAMTDQQRIAAAKSGDLQIDPQRAAEAAALDQKVRDDVLLDSTPGVGRVAMKVTQGLPFVGEWADEAATAMGLDGQYMRDVQGAQERVHPTASMLQRMAGGVLGALPVVGAAGPLARVLPAGLGTQTAVGFGTGALLGGAEGAVSGYGAGTDPASRQTEAFDRGRMGAAVGAAAGAVMPAVTTGVRALVGRLKGKDIVTIAGALGISKDAARVIRQALDADDLDAAAAQLRRAGPDAMLADASPATAQMLDTAMQSGGGAAARIGREAVDARAARASTRLNTVMDGVLGRPEGVKAASKDISMRTAGVRRQAYDRAYATPVDYAADTGRAIEGVLARVPPRTLQAAISEANDAMREAGVRNRQIMAEIAPDGAVTFSEMPNVQQLDEIKKALGTIARNETDPVTGRISAQGVRAKRLAADLSSALADAVPSYKTAVKIGGDKIAEQDAYDMGRRLLLSGSTREEVADLMKGASRDGKAAIARGLRSYIDDTLANVQRTITDPNTDAREAMAAVKAFSSRANREKLEIALGPQRARVLLDAMDEAAKHLELRGNVARNSATASRLAGQRAVEEVTAPGAAGRLMRGEALQGTKAVVQFLTNRTPGYDAIRRQEIYSDIAKALTFLRGPQAEQALKTVQQAMAGQPIKDADAAAIARLLGPSVVLGGHQTATRWLSSPAPGQ